MEEEVWPEYEKIVCVLEVEDELTADQNTAHVTRFLH